MKRANAKQQAININSIDIEKQETKNKYKRVPLGLNKVTILQVVSIGQSVAPNTHTRSQDGE